VRDHRSCRHPWIRPSGRRPTFSLAHPQVTYGCYWAALCTISTNKQNRCRAGSRRRGRAAMTSDASCTYSVPAKSRLYHGRFPSRHLLFLSPLTPDTLPDRPRLIFLNSQPHIHTNAISNPNQASWKRYVSTCHVSCSRSERMASRAPRQPRTHCQKSL